jgi:hypothetical protein
MYKRQPCVRQNAKAAKPDGVVHHWKSTWMPSLLNGPKEREVSRIGEQSCLLSSLQDRSEQVPCMRAIHQQARAGDAVLSRRKLARVLGETYA